jgi:hypothetical protein
MGSRLAWLLLSLVPVAGCQWLLPLGPGGEPADRPRSDRATDGPLSSDRLSSDRRPLDLPADSCRDLLASDGPAGCFESDRPANPDCSKACCSGDCDDLPDHRDPWKSTCNQLVFFDDFCDPTLPKWSQQTGADVVEPGLLQITIPVSYTHWVGAKVPAARGGLVEARLHTIGGADRWELWLSADGDAPIYLPAKSYRMCQVRWDHNELTLTSDVKPPSGLSQNSASVILPTAQGVVVQSWLAGQYHVCRVVVPGYAPFGLTHAFTGSFPVANTAIAVGLINSYPSAATGKIDWVRAFAP